MTTAAYESYGAYSAPGPAFAPDPADLAREEMARLAEAARRETRAARERDMGRFRSADGEPAARTPAGPPAPPPPPPAGHFEARVVPPPVAAPPEPESEPEPKPEPDAPRPMALRRTPAPKDETLKTPDKPFGKARAVTPEDEAGILAHIAANPLKNQRMVAAWFVVHKGGTIAAIANKVSNLVRYGTAYPTPDQVEAAKKGGQNGERGRDRADDRVLPAAHVGEGPGVPGDAVDGAGPAGADAAGGPGGGDHAGGNLDRERLVTTESGGAVASFDKRTLWPPEWLENSRIKPAPAPSPLDAELAAMAACARALESVEPFARARVMTWLNDRFETEGA